uniref:Uncharacterized protein n=1 Tax=Strigamia maritima TaxID=126957 RepID=T1JG90_STRMM
TSAVVLTTPQLEQAESNYSQDRGASVQGAIQLYLRLKLGPEMKFLSRFDAIYATEFNYECAAGIYWIFKGHYDIDQIRNRYADRIMFAKHPDGTYKYQKYHQLLCERYGYYFWMPAPQVDISQHIALYDGEAIANSDQLFGMFEELQSKPLPRSRPLWGLTVAQLADNFENRQGPHFVMYEKLHHVMTNGMNQVKMYTECFIDEPYKENYKIMKLPSMSFGDFFKSWLIGPGFFLKSTIFNDDNALSTFKRSGKLILADISVPISLERFRAIRKATNATVNDIMLSCIAFAIRCHFMRKGLQVPTHVRQIIPFALDFENITHGLNLLPTGDTSPLQRLAATKEQLDQLKFSNVGVFNFFFVHLFPNVLPAKLVNKLIVGAHHTVDISNIFGNQKEVTVFNKPVVDVGGFGPVPPHVGLSIIILSQNGNLTLNASADTAIIENREELKRMLDDVTIGVDDLLKELHEL